MKNAGSVFVIGSILAIWLGSSLFSGLVQGPPPPTLASAAGPTIADSRAQVENAAIDACEKWTRANSKMAVGEVVDRYTVGKMPKWGKLPTGHVRVGIDYRTAGPGLLMEATCEYAMGKNGGGLLVRAESQIKR